MSAEYRAILLRTTDGRTTQESTLHVRRLRDLKTPSAVDRFSQQVADILSLGSRALTAYACRQRSRVWNRKKLLR